MGSNSRSAILGALACHGGVVPHVSGAPPQPSLLQTLAPAVKDKVMVVKVDTEKYPAVAARYSIHALPTLMLFKDGQPVDRVEGVLSAPDIQLRLMKFL